MYQKFHNIVLRNKAITYLFYIVRSSRPSGEFMRKDKLIEISGGKCVAAAVSTASAAIIKAKWEIFTY